VPATSIGSCGMFEGRAKSQVFGAHYAWDRPDLQNNSVEFPWKKPLSFSRLNLYSVRVLSRCRCDRMRWHSCSSRVWRAGWAPAAHSRHRGGAIRTTNGGRERSRPLACTKPKYTRGREGSGGNVADQSPHRLRLCVGIDAMCRHSPWGATRWVRWTVAIGTAQAVGRGPRSPENTCCIACSGNALA